MKNKYCYTHGGWGSSNIPCKVCGSLNPENTMPLIPKGLSLEEALKWGAKQITEEINKSTQQK